MSHAAPEGAPPWRRAEPTPPWEPQIGSYTGISVVEAPELAFDAMHAAGPHLLVGETAHLRWRAWLADQRRQARDEAHAMVRDQLGHLVPDLDETPFYTATERNRRA